MAKVSITKAGDAIIISDFTDVKYHTDGFIYSLKYNGLNYIYCDAENVPDNVKFRYSGFYEESAYLHYAFHRKISLDEFVSIHTLSTKYKIKMGENGDSVEVFMLKRNPDLNNASVVKIKYNWSHTDNAQSYYDINSQRIIIPSNASETPQTMNLNVTASSFYGSELVKINALTLQSQAEKQQLAYMVSLIALKIQNITSNIFPKLDSPPLSTFITSQLQTWGVGLQGVNADYYNYKEYFELFKSYEKSIYVNIEFIQNSNSTEKLVNLAAGLTFNSLRLISLSNRVDILDSILKDKLSVLFENELVENLVISLLSTIDFSDESESNFFLGYLMEVYDYNYHKTRYQVFYEGMSKSFKITEGLIHGANAILGTKFNPTKTKSGFVNAVYAMWYNSLYNPYNLLGELKANKIGFLTPSTNIKFNQVNSNYLYRYTHQVGYIAKQYIAPPEYNYIGPDLLVYETNYELKTTAPICIPYESETMFGFVNQNLCMNFRYFDGVPMIDIYQKLPSDYIPEDDNVAFNTSLKAIERNVFFGRYKILQPISLVNINDNYVPFKALKEDNISAELSELNTLIPAFVLHHMVDTVESENTETMVGYVVEGLTTLAGVGSITKLKHLRWFGGAIGMNTMSGFRITIGTIDFSAGVLSFLQNFIDCDQNNEFCKTVKSYVALLNLATGLILGTDSIISWALRARAAKIVGIAGGVSEAEIRQNITQLLGGGADAGEAAKVIFYSSIIPLPIRAVESIINKAFETIAFSRKKYLLQADYTRESLQNYARTCHALGLTEEEIIHRIVMANRIKKKISLSQLEVETLFSVKVIKDRGFPGGYQNLNKYKAFCFEFEDALWDALDAYDIEFSALFRNKVKIYTGGSSNSRVLATEVLDAKYSAIQRPSNVPGDTDIQIVFESKDIYEKFIIKLNNSHIEYNFNTKSDMVKYELLDELMVKSIYDRVKPHLLSTDPEFFTFAFINPTGKYSNKPRTLFKYE